jgi:hypothetical protein
VYIPNRSLCSFFPFTSWWTFLLMSAIFWMIGANFGLSPIYARVHAARRSMAVSTPP